MCAMAVAPETSTTLLRDLAADTQHVRWTEFYHRYRPLMEEYMGDRFPNLDADEAIRRRNRGAWRLRIGLLAGVLRWRQLVVGPGGLMAEVAYPQNGIRYVLEGMADLSLPNLSNENRRRYMEPFDGKCNRVTFGMGARFEMSEQDMLNLDR